MSNNKLSHVLVLIPLFLFISACATTKVTHPDGTIEERSILDVQFLTDTATALVPVVKDAFSKPEQGATPASQPVSQPKSNPQRQQRTQPASRTTRQSSGRTSPRNNSSNNNNRSSKRSRKSSCNSNNNNQGTCR